MAKFNRPLDDHQLNTSLEKTIQTVLERVPAYPTRKPFFSRFRIVSLGMALTATAVVSFIGLNNLNPTSSSSIVLQSSSSITSGQPNTVNLSTQASQTFANLAYVSAGLLAFEDQLSQLDVMIEPRVAMQRLARSVNLTTATTPQLTTQLDLVSTYFERFQPYLDAGQEPIIAPTLLTSDRIDYASMSTFTVDDEIYTLYLNGGLTDEEVSGLLLVGIEEFVMEGKIEFEDDDEIEMKLTATNSYASMVIEYKKEQDGDQHQVSYLIETTRGDVTTTREVKLERELEEAVVVMTIPEGEIKFKRELEDGENFYSVEYNLNGISGEAVIEVTLIDYRFVISEGDQSEEHHVVPPKIDDDDDDENEED